MRKVSPVALGLMLALGSVSLGVAAPAAFAKEKAPKAPQLKPSAGFIGSVQKLQEAINKKDVAAAQAALEVARAAAKTNDDKFYLGQFEYNLAQLASDETMKISGLKNMLDSGFAEPSAQTQIAVILTQHAYNAKDYDNAIAYGQKAQAFGAKPEDVVPTLAQAIWAKAGNNQAEIARGLDVFKSGIDAMKAAGTAVPEQWYEFGRNKADSANLPQVKDWAAMAYEANPSAFNMRALLIILRRENPAMTNREMLDLLRLMQFSGGLGVKGDFLEYAEMAFKGGIYGEVKSVIDAGRTTRDVRSNFYLSSIDGADTYSIASQKIAGDKATLGAASADAAKSAAGKIAAATADAYMGYGDNAKAISLYEMALKKGGAGLDMAEVTTRLGIAQARAGNIEAAKASFAKVTGSGIRGAIAQFWLKWLSRTPAA